MSQRRNTDPTIDSVTIDTAGGGLGTSYCGPAVNNSTGGPATLGATGIALVSANDVTLVAGETWRYQSWFRDSVGGVATSNITDGLEIAYQ